MIINNLERKTIFLTTLKILILLIDTKEIRINGLEIEYKNLILFNNGLVLITKEMKNIKNKDEKRTITFSKPDVFEFLVQKTIHTCKSINRKIISSKKL